MAIGIEFKEGQGLGNQLWNYSAGVGISKYLGLDFHILNMDQFKGNDFLSLYNSSPECSIAFANEFNEKIYIDTELKYKSSSFDSRIFNINIKENVIIRGLFQDERYLTPIINCLPDLIKFNPKYVDLDNVCILNIRGGEFKKHLNFMLKKSYWDNAISHMKETYDINNFIIVTDDFKYSKLLFPKLDIISNSIYECYNYIYQAKYIVVSNSSFSYFPIKTGNNKNIIIAPAFWARPYNKYERWCSIANYYKNWKYMLPNGCFMDEGSIDISRNKTENFYLTSSSCEFFSNNDVNISSHIVRFKALVKYVLNLILPRYF